MPSREASGSHDLTHARSRLGSRRSFAPPIPGRRRNRLWQVSGLVDAPDRKRSRYLPWHADRAKWFRREYPKGTDSPLRGSHGLTPCSLFSRSRGHQQPMSLLCSVSRDLPTAAPWLI